MGELNQFDNRESEQRTLQPDCMNLEPSRCDMSKVTTHEAVIAPCARSADAILKASAAPLTRACTRDAPAAADLVRI
jgi:hypothetical protein